MIAINAPLFLFRNVNIFAPVFHPVLALWALQKIHFSLEVLLEF